MKKILTLFFTFLMVSIFTSGCVEFNSNITINKDRSADVNLDLLVNKNMQGILQSQINEIKSSYENSEFKNITKNNKVGVSIITHTGSIDSSPLEGLPQSFKAKDNNILIVNKKFFRNIYNFDFEINLLDDVNDQRYASSFIGDDSNIQFTLNLPVKTTYNNAGNVTNNGKTLTWTLLLCNKNKIEASFYLINWLNVIIFLFYIAFITLIIIILKKYKKSFVDYCKKQNQNTIMCISSILIVCLLLPLWNTLSTNIVFGLFYTILLVSTVCMILTKYRKSFINYCKKLNPIILILILTLLIIFLSLPMIDAILRAFFPNYWIAFSTMLENFYDIRYSIMDIFESIVGIF